MVIEAEMNELKARVSLPSLDIEQGLLDSGQVYPY